MSRTRRIITALAIAVPMLGLAGGVVASAATGTPQIRYHTAPCFCAPAHHALADGAVPDIRYRG